MGLCLFIWLLMFLRLQLGVLGKLQLGVLGKTPSVSGGKSAYTEISHGLVLSNDEAGCWSSDLSPRLMWCGVGATSLIGCAYLHE